VELHDLPSTLPTVSAANVVDPDGAIERALAPLLLQGDTIGAARLALTIRNDYRRAAWLQHFRPATLAAARGAL
jgi:hypothetical protein